MQRLTPFVAMCLVLAACADSENRTVKDTAPQPGRDTVRPLDDTVASTPGTDTATAGTPDCSVLSRTIPPLKQRRRVSQDLAELRYCGIDSFDYVYIVPNLFYSWASENEVAGKKMQYGDFISHLHDFHETESYTQLRERVKTLDSLRTVPFELKRLHAMKPVLGGLGFTEREWNMFSGFAATYPVPAGRKFTWGDMLDEFEKHNTPSPE
jgi:hypothetical protein